MSNILLKKHFERLYEYQKKEDYINAFETIESILFIDKGNKEALFRQAHCLARVERYQAAFKKFSKLVNDKVFGYKSILFMKLCFNKLDIKTEVLPTLMGLVGKYPNNYNLLFYYADALYKTEKYSQAIHQFKKVIELGHKDESFINQIIAECWFKKGNYKKAIKYIDLAIIKYTSCLTFTLAELYYKKAKCYQCVQDLENAYINAKLALKFIDNFKVWSDLEYNDIFDIIVSKENASTLSNI
jgi:tetratricopeptide (TPR) repeat protein